MLEPAALGLTLQSRIQVLHYAAPPVRQKGQVVKDVPELMAALVARGLI
jgi:hypothetical protein